MEYHLQYMPPEELERVYPKMEQDFPPNELKRQPHLRALMESGMSVGWYLMADGKAAGYAFMLRHPAVPYVLLDYLAMEERGHGAGSACLALLNDAVKKGGVMASNHVGGLSGAFIPVSEDAGMIHAAEIGCLTIEKLEAMTAVCSVGIDMVIIPGDTTPAVISALIADEAAIGMVNSKTTAVRVIPAIGRKAGEVLDFGGLLGYGPIMPVNSHDPSVFINRGGRLPAPMQSLKN